MYELKKSVIRKNILRHKAMCYQTIIRSLMLMYPFKHFLNIQTVVKRRKKCKLYPLDILCIESLTNFVWFHDLSPLNLSGSLFYVATYKIEPKIWIPAYTYELNVHHT